MSRACVCHAVINIRRTHSKYIRFRDATTAYGNTFIWKSTHINQAQAILHRTLAHCARELISRALLKVRVFSYSLMMASEDASAKNTYICVYIYITSKSNGVGTHKTQQKQQQQAISSIDSKLQCDRLQISRYSDSYANIITHTTCEMNFRDFPFHPLNGGDPRARQ